MAKDPPSLVNTATVYCTLGYHGGAVTHQAISSSCVLQLPCHSTHHLEPSRWGLESVQRRLEVTACLRRRLLGEEHLHTLDNINNLAIVISVAIELIKVCAQDCSIVEHKAMYLLLLNLHSEYVTTACRPNRCVPVCLKLRRSFCPCRFHNISASNNILQECIFVWVSMKFSNKIYGSLCTKLSKPSTREIVSPGTRCAELFYCHALCYLCRSECSLALCQRRWCRVIRLEPSSPLSLARKC